MSLRAPGGGGESEEKELEVLRVKELCCGSHGAAGQTASGSAAAEAHHLHCDSETVVPDLILEIRNTPEFEEKSETNLSDLY